jgi:ubiquinone/menaquinone biosynthesis C-methylase UbiE
MVRYNSISRGYNKLYMEEQLKKIRLIKENIKIKKSDLLLDVGCGTGISSEFECNVVGIDPCFELLKQSNKAKVGARAENLPFKDGTFDIVVSVTAIHNFNNIKKGLKEMRRVGKDKFVFSVLKKSKKISQITRLIERYFRVNKAVEEDKDIIFFAGRKQKLYKQLRLKK